jgi:hypothetical protein
MLEFGGTSMVLDSFFPDSNTDGFRITQFLLHRMVQEISCDRGFRSLSLRGFKDRMRIFQILFEGDMFARGKGTPTIKTFKVDRTFLDDAKLTVLQSYVTEIR